MKKSCLVYCITAVAVLSISSAYADLEKKIAISDLLEQKCSKCHSSDRAKIMHTSKDTFLGIINKMRQKKGADISDEDAKGIASFLGTPSRFLLESKCTKCHGLDRIIDAHKKGTLTKATLQKMQQKKDSGISGKEVESIYEMLNQFYYAAPMPPSSPGFP